MADLQEETVGEAVGEPRQEKEAIPISQNDVVKENGELPESVVEIGGKEKEDPTLINTAPATGNGKSEVIASEEANDTNRPSPPPQEPSLSDGVKEGGQVREATPVPPAEEEHGSSTMQSIQETFLSFVGLGSRHSGVKAHSPDVPRAEEEGGTKSEEAEKVPRVADGVPQSTETESTEISQKGQAEETAETFGHMQTKTEEGLEGIPKFAEETPNFVDGPKTQVERGTIEQVDTAKTDDALKTLGGETEAPQKSTETNEAQAGAVSEAEIAKSEEKSDEAQGVEVVEPSIPTSIADINEAHEPRGAEVAKGAIFKADGTTERDGESKSPKASKVVAPFYKVVAKVAEVVEKAVSKEDNSAAGAGQAIPAAEDIVESRRIEEGINSQEVVAAPPPTPVEQDQPAVEADDTTQPKSFFGVVLKRVESNGKVSTESSLMGNHNSSNAEGSDNVDKSPEEAHEKELVAPLPAAITEKETMSGNGAPSDVSLWKEATQTEADEAPNVEAKSDPTTSSDTPAVLEAVSTELSKDSATGTVDFAEEGTVVDLTKETGVSAPKVEEKETPPPELSREFPGGASEEGKSPMASAVVAPFYKVVAKVAEVVENTVSPEEQGKIPNETNLEQKPEEAAETKLGEAIPQEGSKVAEDTTGQVTEEILKGATPKEETSLPVKMDASEEKIAELDGSALEKQPSLSVNISKQGEAAAPVVETPEEETAEDLTTPRGTPLMQRVEHLEQKLAQLESRQSPRSDFASRQSTPRSSVDRPFKFSTRYVLEETGSKGTLVDRVAALEQKLAHINLHPESPSNGEPTPSISTVAENISTEVDSKPAESQTREWSPSAAEDDKAPEQVKSEEAAKATQDPLNPSVEENAPKDLPAQAQPIAPQKTSRSDSLSEKKVKAKAAAGKIKGLFSGCFHPKKGKTVSSTAS